MPPIEGLTPEILWYTLAGLVGIGALIILGDKVAEVFRKRKQREALKSTPSERLAEDISRKVMDTLEPRCEEIDRKLATDKIRLDEHDRRLAELGIRLDEHDQGVKVLCRAILALMSHAINGNDVEKLKVAQAELQNYLIDR